MLPTLIGSQDVRRFAGEAAQAVGGGITLLKLHNIVMELFPSADPLIGDSLFLLLPGPLRGRLPGLLLADSLRRPVGLWGLKVPQHPGAAGAQDSQQLGSLRTL